MAWPWEAEGLLLIAILLLGHLEHLPFGIGAKFAGKDSAVLIEVCCAAQPFEQLIGKQPVLARVITMGFLD
jgi:hypothetical protein